MIWSDKLTVGGGHARDGDGKTSRGEETSD